MTAPVAGRFMMAVTIATISLAVGGPGRAQSPSWGPTTAVSPPPPSAMWPARPPARIYVVPFPMEPGLEQQLAQASTGFLPQGPVRQFMAGRPRVTDMVTGFDRQAPVGVSIAQQVADGLVRAGLPAVLWMQPAPPPADGWQLHGEIVGLDEGSAAARSLVGFGAGNKKIGVDVVLSDPMTAGGRVFFVLNTSDRGRLAPGAVAMGAVTGFNPFVMIGRTAITSSGISDITQQGRISGEIVESLAGAMRQHGQLPPR